MKRQQSNPYIEPLSPACSEQLLDEVYSLYRSYLMAQSELDPMKPVNIDFSLLYPDTKDLSALISQVDDLKRCLDSFRPLEPLQAKKLQEIFDTEYTYHSNHIEGNTMTLRETSLILSEGVTIAGKSLKEHLEVINHKEAFEFVKDVVQRKEDLSRRIILEIHALILHGDRENAGKYRTVPVAIKGSRHNPPEHFRIEDLMEQYFQDFAARDSAEHPLILAADMSERLVTIHPFIDGNGRTSRLLMNLLLLRAGYPLTIIRSEDKGAYFDALESVQVGEDETAFRRYLLKEVKRMFFRYLNLIPKNGDTRHSGNGDYFFQRIGPLFVD